MSVIGEKNSTKRKGGALVCAVYNCNSNSQKDPGVSFHSFPKESQKNVKIINGKNLNL